MAYLKSLPSLSSLVSLCTESTSPCKKALATLEMLRGVQDMAVWIPCQEVLLDNFRRAGMPAVNMSCTEVSGTWMGANLCFALWMLKAIPWPCYRSNIYARMKCSIVKAFGQIENFVFPHYYL